MEAIRTDNEDCCKYRSLGTESRLVVHMASFNHKSHYFIAASSLIIS